MEEVKSLEEVVVVKILKEEVVVKTLEEVEVVEVVKKVEGPIEEPKTEEEKKLFPILDAMGIEHVDVGGRSDA